ncbi:hypothetical protein V8F20_012448 [Naviculisporaceae sp. PSN 640]
MTSDIKAIYQNAPRYLTLTAAKEVWDSKKAKPKSFLRTPPPRRAGDVKEDPEPTDLKTGYELLHSYYSPGLPANSEQPVNIINIKQIIEPDSATPLKLESNQEFVVIAPQFSLPAGDIHSVYPPPGSSASAAILPHVVFNNPHLPWEREVIQPDKEKDPGRNRTPWMALMAFTADEITLDPSDLAGDNRIFTSDVTQSDSLAITQTLGSLSQIKPENAKSQLPAGYDPTITANFVFMKPDVFTDFFTVGPGQGGVPLPQTQPDLSMYRFLAHSRAINTKGMANAGLQDDGIYSVIVSRRCGVWNNKTPVPIYVHLVSIDEAELLTPWPMSDTKHVALCSLYSWTYRCDPPESVDIADALKELAGTKDMLGPSPALYNDWMDDPEDPVKQALGLRLRDGFTMTRYLVQSGEETAGFYRGPCVPRAVQRPLTSLFPRQSTYSSDLQILDRTLGIMDVTYSTAWQLGRTLGLADQAFFTALGRLRTAIYTVALDNAKKALLGSAHRTATDVVANLSASFKKLESLTTDHDTSPEQRWNRSASTGSVDLSLWSPDMQAAFAKAAQDAAFDFAQSPDKGFYNELNRANSPDYAVVLKWILDRRFLFGIPAHYLISDPSFLPKESLRYFQIDQNWVDALVDGALSLANHIEQDNDVVRKAINDAINAYIATADPVLGYKPQIPVFGFFLRSDIVTQFPDLHVDIPFTTTASSKAPLVRHENIDQGVMLVLLDRLPGDTELTQMTLTQPPHQQRFAAASTVGIEPGANPPVLTPEFEVQHKSIFTVADPPPDVMKQQCGPPYFEYQGKTYDNAVFDFESRMVHIDNFASHVFSNLKENMAAGYFTDTCATAAMMAIQLNDPVYSITIDFPGVLPPPNSPGSTVPSDIQACAHSGTVQMVERKTRSSVSAMYQEWIASRKALTASNLSCAQPGASSAVPSTPAQTSHTRRPIQRPPHFKRIPSIEAPQLQLPTDPSTPLPVFAETPQFDYGVWSIGSISGGNNHPPVPTRSGIAQDLVISIVLPPDQRTIGAFVLMEIDVVIPYGPRDNPAQRTNLFTSYTGPGPVMLSNLRFNVQAVFQKHPDGPVMLLKIIPRLVEGTVPVQVIDEISVLLPRVEVNNYTEQDMFVEFTFNEYWTFQPKVPVPRTVNVSLDTSLPSSIEI